MIKNLKIQIPKGYEIDVDNSTFHNIVFKKIEKMFPKTWEEFCEQNPATIEECFISDISGIAQINTHHHRHCIVDANLLKNNKDAEAHLALIKLHRLRDVYRQEWVPDWDNVKQAKYCIEACQKGFDLIVHYRDRSFLAFQTPEIAKSLTIISTI